LVISLTLLNARSDFLIIALVIIDFLEKARCCQVQKTQEIPPYTKFPFITFTPLSIVAFITYKGEMPMSPIIMPSAINKPAVEIRLWSFGISFCILFLFVYRRDEGSKEDYLRKGTAKRLNCKAWRSEMATCFK
jgi:hypothetical protein